MTGSGHSKTAHRHIEQGNIRPAFHNTGLDWLQMRFGQAIAETPGSVGITIDRLFSELEKEYGSVSVNDLDPRYIKHLLVRP